MKVYKDYSTAAKSILDGLKKKGGGIKIDNSYVPWDH